MNKLLLAATLAASLGGYVMASDCAEPIRPVEACAIVYDFNVNVKTTVAKPGKVVQVACQEDNETPCYRVKGSKSLKGFVALCGCVCEPVYDGYETYTTNWLEDIVISVDTNWVTTTTIVGYDLNDAWSAVLWENKTKQVFVDVGDDFVWDAFWRIGKKNTDMEVAWTIDGDYAKLQGMGFGSVNNKNIVKSMSGNVTGWLGAPIYFDPKDKYGYEDCGCEAYPYSFCDVDYLDGVDTVAFGSWKMKYNAKASANYLNGYLPVPKWY